MYSRHKKPLIFGVAIVGLALLTSTSVYIASSFIKNKPDDPPVKPDPIEIDELIRRYKECKKEGKDPLNVFNCCDLANLSIHLFLRNNSSFLAIGQGENVSVGTVYVTNALIRTEDYSFEESISFSSNALASLFTHCKRDYLDDESVTSYSGKSFEDKYKAVWDKSSKVSASRTDFYNEVGKLPNDAFVYDITKDTVYEEKSTKQKTNDGYKISIELDPDKSTIRYTKRIKYMSGTEPNCFNSINLTLITDSDFNLKETIVNENYTIMSFITNNGVLDTKYITENVPDIPDINTNFEYTRYIK